MHKLSSLTLAIATACALTACSNDTSTPDSSPGTDSVDDTTVAEEETTTEDSDDDTSTEEDSTPSPTTAADDDDADDANDGAHDDAEENTTNASQIGGDCGTTPQGDPITAGSSTSCEFAVVMFAPASKASYTMTRYDPSNPTVGSLYTAHITAKSPVTGENYDLTCRIGNDLANLTCEKPGDRSVSGSFNS
ncbi:hypothetical protein HMPREF2635_01570, partial [Corynebacterium sp. HMSC035E02]|uniref:hypothetical protein n=1 Tax=Corynebacterium sp. HMSC035E02 TaxID=1715114 RepID=UPI0008A8B21C